MTTTHPPVPSTIPGLVVGVATGQRAGGGISPAGERDVERCLRVDGHAVAYFSSRIPTAHRVSGCGIGHDDAAFCERRDSSGGSMAAYYENGDGRLRWWEDTRHPFSIGVKHYGCADLSSFGRVGGRDQASAVLARRSGVER